KACADFGEGMCRLRRTVLDVRCQLKTHCVRSRGARFARDAAERTACARPAARFTRFGCCRSTPSRISVRDRGPAARDRRSTAGRLWPKPLRVGLRPPQPQFSALFEPGRIGELSIANRALM